MGGKAMATLGIETERKNTNDHLRIQSELIPIIGEMFNTPVKGIKFYREKETHGDLDLLIQNYGQLDNIQKKLSDKFGKIFCNGAVYSFEYDKYQIDIIPQTLKYWDFCNNFFDYDPVGNLMGKTAHKFGLKFGFHGLEYPCRTYNGRYADDITISTDAEKIFNFLGFDYQRYLLGFDKLEDIFEFVISSKYFRSETFYMDNLNHIDKKRNAKRATYQNFLEYINTQLIEKTYEFLPKTEYLSIIDAEFPEANLIEKLREFRIRDEVNEIVHKKFNGNLIMEWTEKKLAGKQLGDAIHKFTTFVEEKFNCSFKNWALHTPEKEIYELFMNVINN